MLKEAWSFYRFFSRIRPCWELEEPQGPQGQFTLAEDADVETGAESQSVQIPV